MTNKPRIIKSTAEYRKLLPPGTTTNQLIALLGKPKSVDSEPNNIEAWRYALSPFPAVDTMRGSYVIGLMAYVTNARLARVEFTYMGGPITTAAREQIQSPGASSHSGAMKLFIVNPEATQGARFIDTPQLPKLGYVGAVPALTVNKLDELALEQQEHKDSEGRTRTNWVFQASLTPADSARLKALTRSNIDKQLLITVGDLPVVAPRIVQALDTGQLQIWCHETMRDHVKSNLATLKR